jgi:hypothetical protein
MAKRAREQRLKERRALKLEKKAAARDAKLAGTGLDGDGVEDGIVENGQEVVEDGGEVVEDVDATNRPTV